MSMENNKLEKMYFLLFAELFRKFLLLTSFCLFNSKKPGRQNSKIKPPSSTIYLKNKNSRKNSIFQKLSLTSFCKITAEISGNKSQVFKETTFEW